MLRVLIILLVSSLGLCLTWRYLRINLAAIRVRNQSEPSPYRRALNYPLTLLWYGYLAALFIGLSVNNLLH